MLSVCAQPTGHFMKFGLGYSYQSVLDQAMSPVTYNGHFGQLQIGYYDQNNLWISDFDLSALGGLQRPVSLRDETNRQTLSGLARLRYTLARQFTTFGRWRFFAGLSSLNSFDYRNHNQYRNSESNYIALFSLGPSAGVQREFELFQQNWGLQVFMDVPLTGYYLRPGYIKPFFNGDIGSKGFVWWGDFFMLNTRSDLIYYLPNGNQLRLSYQWEYLGLQPLNKVQTATHQISLCAVFRF